MRTDSAVVRSDTPPAGRRVTVTVANRRHLIALAIGIAILVVLAFFPLFGGTAWTRRLIDFLLFVAMAQMWNLLLGFGGIISVGQQGYIGIGCYSVWLFADVLHVPLFLSVVLAAVVGGLVAIPSAAVVFKLRMGYLAIGTMVLAEMYRMIVGNIEATGGGSGVTIQAATGISNESRIAGTFWWALAAAAIAIAVVYFILRSRTGMALKAVRDDDLAAQSLGVNLWRTRLYVFVVAGAGCARPPGAIRAYARMQGRGNRPPYRHDQVLRYPVESLSSRCLFATSSSRGWPRAADCSCPSDCRL